MQCFRPICTLTLATLLISGCTGGRTAFSTAEKLEQEGNLDAAMVKYLEVAKAHPEVGEYRVKLLNVVAAAGNEHFKKGEAFFALKNYDDALREYQSAYAIDPSRGQAKLQAELSLKLRNAQTYYQEGVEFERTHKPREAMVSYKHALEFNPNDKLAKQSLERLVAGKKQKLDGFELNLKSTKPITLKFRDAKLKEIFNILSQLSGINFVFDEAVKDVNVSLFLENATFQQAMEIITGMHKLDKKVLNESTIIIFPRTPDKLKQYEELFLQTFYLNKLDAKKAVNLIRTMLQVKKIYVNEEMNALVIRDTPEVIEVARKILEANDVPDAEVLLEVEVLELNKQNAETFGLALSKYSISAVATNPSGNIMVDSLTQVTNNSSTTGTTTTNTSPSNLLNFFAYKGYNGYLTVPNATYNFGKTLTNSDVLSNPKIRVKNREKAKFNVGTRVPITTTSSPSTGGINVNVQYVDVGVKVNAEPTIQINNEVSIKLSLEVSTIISKETIGTDQATTVVTIGTRNLDTVLSLKDGETSIIGGLIQKNKTDSKNKIFLIGDIPLIGPLLSNTTDSNSKTELLLAITPRIVRGVSVPDNDVAAFWSGREDEPSSNKPYQSFSEEAAVPTTVSPAITTQSTIASAAPLDIAPVAPGRAALTETRRLKRAEAEAAAGVPGAAATPAQGAESTPAAPAPAAAAQVPAPAAATPAPPAPAPAPAAVVSAPAVPAPAPAPAAPVPDIKPQLAPQPVPVPPPPAPAAPAVAPAPSSGVPAGSAAVAAPQAMAPQAAAPAPASQAAALAAQAQGAVPVQAAKTPVAAGSGAASVAAANPANGAAGTGQIEKVSLTVGVPSSAQLGSEFSVEVTASGAKELYNAVFAVSYDPAKLDAVSQTEGAFLKQKETPVSFQAFADKKKGLVWISASRTSSKEGASGSGALATVTFKAIGKGSAQVGLTNTTFTTRTGDKIPVTAFKSAVEVK